MDHSCIILNYVNVLTVLLLSPSCCRTPLYDVQQHVLTGEIIRSNLKRFTPHAELLGKIGQYWAICCQVLSVNQSI
ncbi:hypothetical protein K402DRAFT_398160 [Aulographum hederae CBS 113979]|uniref:Secreted protein n=1 Tax=Aulographum hederae CBS 113979 TaxID=1176131 RepID=A0A6G1GLU7_9PEZI|nr:hypothetical protein K402DRAFT_398160 [Aulographum hederae CBS 113979]